ncbi:MAG: cytochrome c [Ruegeria sp.]|uniref:c-type cytochrome n=1 Tax=Ruegeria sp. TaxID=1879320 RepID=UPI00349E9545
MIGLVTKHFGLAGLAACALLALPASAQDVERGEGLYFHHCAACHGREATGHGPMAGVLIIQPVDLTALTGEDGVFPTERVVKRIDGRDPLVSHGSPMPVYGPYFEGRDTAIKTPAGQPILTSEPIVDLVAYLQTLQRN